MVTKKMTMNDYDIFCDNGKYVAVRTLGGERRNVAPHNCKTKRAATEAAREDRDRLNSLEPDELSDVRDSTYRQTKSPLLRPGETWDIKNDLAAWRKKHGLSRDKLAKLLDVSNVTIMSWETGKRNPPDTMLRLALAELERRLTNE